MYMYTQQSPILTIGTRTQDAWEAAIKRFHKSVHLTEAETEVPEVEYFWNEKDAMDHQRKLMER